MRQPTTALGSLLLIGLLAAPAGAAEVVTCTGKLSETPRLAVVVDPAGYTCTVDLRGAGHDPMRPCSVGDICRLTGRGHRSGSTGKTYAIDEIIDVDPVSADTAHAAERLPDELQGCWRWTNGTKVDAFYDRVSADECKGFGKMLISSDGYGMNDGDIDCRLRSIVSAKPGQYRLRFQCIGGPVFTSTMALRGNQLTVRETE